MTGPDATQTDCPTQEALAGYLLGDSGTDTARIHDHLEHCTRCRAFVNEVRDNDFMLDSIRRVLDEESDAPTVTHFGRSRGSWGSDDTPLDASDSGTYATATPGSTHIEGYRILSELGRGGMGVVYKAIQTSTKRQVALKVLLEGPFASRSARRRFEREVELAAQLSHSNIVTILESGIASGRYYFAMQYVEGERLDRHIADHALNLDGKLRLFIKLCRAVNYAHQRGVIHRDLKPSNIVVDDQGEPHILDFGLAKLSATEAAPQEAVVSVTGQIMGTLPYMSPEQTTGTSDDVDIRTDVYSLGVILYEMLTGRYPYVVVGRMIDVLHNIAEAEPERPSTLLRTINDEIETIVLKSLAKDKERRYQSADNLATDVERYLNGEPIEAKRDSATYVLLKMLKRHRGPVAVFAGFVLLLSVSVGLILRHRADVVRAEAFALSAALVDDPGQAIPAIVQAAGPVQRRLVERATLAVNSDAWTERIVGARGGWLLDPEAFWQSIDAGVLWRNGEWLELIDLPERERPRLRPILLDRLRHGTPPQQYAALCLLAHHGPPDQEARQAMRDALENATHPGVAMTAWWSLRRHGIDADLPPGDFLFRDDLTGLVFIEVSGTPSFTPGAEPTDPDQLPDEKRAEQGVPVASFHMAVTELTFDAFAPFLAEPRHREQLAPEMVAWFAQERKTLEGNDGERVALGMVSLDLARTYCQWLNRQAADRTPRRRYRLPSETEWEYACRAGNVGRFCYGRDGDYLEYFARCNGEAVALHRVAEFLPNYYGLFDMHGGLWELCNSRYPAEFADPQHREQELWVQRGGGYYSPPRRCRSSQRNYITANGAHHYTGVRLVMEMLP